MIRREQFPALTSLRFFAALHVVFFHFLGPLLEGSALLSRLASHGYISVTFFYALSGFVLAQAYGDAGRFGAGERTAFWQKRFARIYPIYVAAFLAYAPFAIQHRYAADVGLVATLKLAVSSVVNLTALQAWAPPLASAWNAPSWSISAEAFFYLIFPWLCPWLTSIERPLRALLLAWLLALVVPTTAVALRLAPDAASEAAATLAPFLRCCPALHLPSFAFGILLKRVRDERSVSGIWLPVSALAAGALLVAAPSYLGPILHNGGLLPIFGLLLLAATAPPTRWTKFLNHPALVFLGESSYALYVLQVPVWVWCSSLLSRPESSIALLGYLALLVAIAGVAHVMLELPARRSLTRLFGARRVLETNTS